MSICNCGDQEAPKSEGPLAIGKDGDKCPKCSRTNTFIGYGMMGGGCGAYEGCDDCDYFNKVDDELQTVRRARRRP